MIPFCDMCRKPFKDGEGKVDIVYGEHEADTGGMASHGSLGRLHDRCWNRIVESLEFYKICLLEKVPDVS